MTNEFNNHRSYICSKSNIALCISLRFAQTSIKEIPLDSNTLLPTPISTPYHAGDLIGENSTLSDLLENISPGKLRLLYSLWNADSLKRYLTKCCLNERLKPAIIYNIINYIISCCFYSVIHNNVSTKIFRAALNSFIQSKIMLKGIVTTK